MLAYISMPKCKSQCPTFKLFIQETQLSILSLSLSLSLSHPHKSKNMGQLHVLLFPMLAQGHMIPILDMAKLFHSRGLKTTILTTPLNAPFFTRPIERIRRLEAPEIGLRVVKFPSIEAGLPEGCESIGNISDELMPKFIKAIALLQEPFEQILQECHPDFVVVDMFFPWATDAAAKFGIPRLVFHGTCYFSLCASESAREYRPFDNRSTDSEPFILPNLPHQIKLTRKQMNPHVLDEHKSEYFVKLRHQMIQSELTSYGVIMNSFCELEPDYVDHYEKVMGRRTWHIGPLLLCNKGFEDKAERGNPASIGEHECLNWLNSKKPKSVIYVCFGSIANFTASQMYEIAMGLEASGQQFIWVLRKGKEEGGRNEDQWLPQGFEDRIKDRGLIIRGWAPQVLILEHDAVGGFVTHCGWNSTLEGVCAGVPMVTWPVFAEQFFTEKLVTDVLRIGVGVGSKEWNRIASEGVKREAVEDALKRVMEGEEAEKTRNRAQALKEMARRTVEEGGSSYSDLNDLIEGLSSRCSSGNKITWKAGTD